MDYTMGIRNKVLDKTLGEVMNQYDKDKNGFSNAEVKTMLKGCASIFAKPFISDKVVNDVRGRLDSDKNNNISEKELDKYLKLNYSIDLETAKGMKIEDLADKIQAIDSANKAKTKAKSKK